MNIITEKAKRLKEKAKFDELLEELIIPTLMKEDKDDFYSIVDVVIKDTFCKNLEEYINFLHSVNKTITDLESYIYNTSAIRHYIFLQSLLKSNIFGIKEFYDDSFFDSYSYGPGSCGYDYFNVMLYRCCTIKRKGYEDFLEEKFEVLTSKISDNTSNVFHRILTFTPKENCISNFEKAKLICSLFTDKNDMDSVFNNLECESNIFLISNFINSMLDVKSMSDLNCELEKIKDNLPHIPDKIFLMFCAYAQSEVQIPLDVKIKIFDFSLKNLITLSTVNVSEEAMCKQLDWKFFGQHYVKDFKFILKLVATNPTSIYAKSLLEVLKERNYDFENVFSDYKLITYYATLEESTFISFKNLIKSYKE